MKYNEFDMKILKFIPIIQRKINGFTEYRVGNVEFYPTEECNLNCLYCTYKNKKKNTFPFRNIEESMLKLNPNSITISGAGEPSCYLNDGYTSVDIVNLIKRILPLTKIGFITNGQKTLDGDWVKKLEWLRVSIDAATETSFEKLKGGSLSKSLRTIITYLKNGCKYVGIGYVFNKNNVSEIYSFTKLIYNLILDNLGYDYLSRIFLEFRPTCKIESCNCPSPRYKNDKLMTADLTSEWHSNLKNLNNDIFNNNDFRYVQFVKNRSNLEEGKLLRYYNEKLFFTKCFYCLAKMIIYPNGECYPCVLKASTRESSLGNIITDTQATILKNQLLCYNGKIICNGYADCCNVISQKNSIVEEFFSHKTVVPDTSHIRWSDFI